MTDKKKEKSRGVRVGGLGEWLVYALAVSGVWWLVRGLSGWVVMWSLAGVMFGGYKWLSLRRVAGGTLCERGGFLFLWPGMDARAFLEGRGETGLPLVGLSLAWGLAGGTMLWGVARLMPGEVLAGWCGMIGFVLLLHFGITGLLSRWWCTHGFGARPIMDAPWRAATVAEFWGRRWNRGFSDVARVALFRPLMRRYGAAAGTLAAFGLSGVAHELVISVPAGAGFGLPTLYFLIQGMAVLLERRVHLWPLLIVMLPAPLLFHPAFHREVMVPFLHVIHAL